jgi:hypothetical protein
MLSKATVCNMADVCEHDAALDVQGSEQENERQLAGSKEQRATRSRALRASLPRSISNVCGSSQILVDGGVVFDRGRDSCFDLMAVKVPTYTGAFL